MKTTLIIIAIIVVLGGGYWLMNKDEAAPADTSAETPATTNTDNTSGTGVNVDVSSGVNIAPSIKEFTVTGSNFSFTPSSLRVNKGDMVRITFKNSGGNHDWVLDAFGVRTKVLGSGQSETIEFVADKAGSFEYYCSVGTHRQMGMVGTLVVQ